jgi:hypothetical protein
VFTWWVTGTMAIACYTAAFVWVMELATGKILIDESRKVPKCTAISPYIFISISDERERTVLFGMFSDSSIICILSKLISLKF